MTQAMDPLDELAALFLTEPDAPRADGGAAARAEVELLLVGHLPVRASLWLTPYADAVSRRHGPTALLRLDDEHAQLQVLRDESGDVESALAAPVTLRETIRAVRRRVRMWVVRLAGESDLQSLVGKADRITILSSADEAAMVAAYQIIKQIVAAAGADAPRPPIALALLGCEPATARNAIDRLNRTTRSFLDLEVGLGLCLPRMDAGMALSGSRRFTNEAAPAPADVIAWLREPVAPAAATPEPMSDSSRRAEDDPADRRREQRHAMDRGTQPAPPRRRDVPRFEMPPPPEPAPPAPSLEEPEPWVSKRTVKLAPKASIEVEPKHPCAPREPSEGGAPKPLAHHVEHLDALPVRCPGRERVEIAVDRDGRLHLLGRDAELRAMEYVARWAVEHRELIALACPDRRIDAARPARRHVFTDTPTELSDLQGADVHLHVLAPVKVGEDVGWYCAPLNRV